MFFTADSSRTPTLVTAAETASTASFQYFDGVVGAQFSKLLTTVHQGVGGVSAANAKLILAKESLLYLRPWTLILSLLPKNVILAASRLCDETSIPAFVILSS